MGTTQRRLQTPPEQSLDLEGLLFARRAVRTGMARAIRVGSDLSQGEIARSCGASVSAVSRWEAQERTPRGLVGAAYGRLLRDLQAADA